MSPRYTLPMLLATAALLSACASQKTPATADVAVSRAAVENATQAGAAELAPAELLAAREKLQQASRALADKDYKLASDLAQQAQADAKLAQSKATSAKATSAANEVQENVRVLREELDRANKQ
ncbi:DUF4398 domain-containing protein [Massilia dura]|uniref:DUF4398 domain-containing protein n=1 Tax=Pseudoduganella dura TaxID=321982 RepID=A0A6I3XE48_9BURK|nr:DUF4398 domain-containing protein [Pseudoduganella dura]MUI11861.1 DUF4398 domain-containing protein [Pseudoduganella dura]GGY08877.1 hypothetical protein GCM10007386_44170 [Pseudoduganella dura]